jgi:hypothetical protein
MFLGFKNLSPIGPQGFKDPVTVQETPIVDRNYGLMPGNEAIIQINPVLSCPMAVHSFA